MPFDATPSEKKPNLLRLADLLDNLPSEWRWDYGHLACCAVGVASSYLNAPLDIGNNMRQFKVFFGISTHQCTQIFFSRDLRMYSPQSVAKECRRVHRFNNGKLGKFLYRILLSAL